MKPVVLQITVRRVRPGREQQLRRWFAELEGGRRKEAELTLREEGIRHETASFVQCADGLLLVYAMESDDFAQARAVADASSHAVDADHRRVLSECLMPRGDPVQQVVLDLRGS